MLHYLAKIPDVVWSGLLASALTLAGVMLSNRSNTKRLLKQLSHDSEENGKNRINFLRKEVYLEAAEKMAKANGYLGKIPQMDPVKDNIADGLSDFFAAAAKLQLVSQPDTSQLAGELVTRYGEILLGLLAKAAPVHSLNTDIRIASDFYDRNQAEVTRILAEMTQLNESGHPNPIQFAALQRSYESAQEAANHFADERSRAYEQQASAMRDYTTTLLNEIRSVGGLQVQVTAAIRSELGLTTDIIEYEALLQKNSSRMDKAIQGLLTKLEES
ncbi:MAG: hypothetical protein ABGX87_05305 [Alcanivorax sp.]|uniref:hypothetical protein n=1 Tax=Alloalcanivorax marinus TaxID=1177169 RepID=UPI00195E4BEE|nr:hypothetical protein [Alloalcanivorax marinus]MBM7334857.1 hypothetical protein [Alloalcanivorax marinus]